MSQRSEAAADSAFSIVLTNEQRGGVYTTGQTTKNATQNTHTIRKYNDERVKWSKTQNLDSKQNKTKTCCCCPSLPPTKTPRHDEQRLRVVLPAGPCDSIRPPNRVSCLGYSTARTHQNRHVNNTCTARRSGEPPPPLPPQRAPQKTQFNGIDNQSHFTLPRGTAVSALVSCILMPKARVTHY